MPRQMAFLFGEVHHSLSANNGSIPPVSGFVRRS